jgi:hypothetical protein
MRWKPALNAFAITFGDRFPAAETMPRRGRLPVSSRVGGQTERPTSLPCDLRLPGFSARGDRVQEWGADVSLRLRPGS